MINEVRLMGNLGADPELRPTNSGGQALNFRMATTDRWKDKRTGEDKEKTEWHRVVMFDAVAERMYEKLRKGMMVYVEGKLQTRSWEVDGGMKYMTEIKSFRCIPLTKSEGAPGRVANQLQQPLGNDDIPF